MSRWRRYASLGGLTTRLTGHGVRERLFGQTDRLGAARHPHPVLASTALGSSSWRRSSLTQVSGAPTTSPTSWITRNGSSGSLLVMKSCASCLPVVSATKGIEIETFRTPSEILGELLGKRRLAVL